MREAQRARGEKPRYDGRWRPSRARPAAGARPACSRWCAFANPLDGEVTWDDMVKGPITISNRELDDLIIAGPTARRPTTSASWSTTGTWRSAT